MRRFASLSVALLLMVLAVSCTDMPLPTPTPYPTYTPLPTYTPYPTPSPMPTATSAPTSTPKPVPTPTSALVPTPTPTPVPVVTPKVSHWDWLVPDDYKSLADAVQVAAPEDVIRIRAGTYPGKGAIIINKSLTLVGDGAEATVLEYGLNITQGSVRVMYLTTQRVVGAAMVQNVNADVVSGATVSVLDSKVNSISTTGTLGWSDVTNSRIGEFRGLSVLGGHVDLTNNLISGELRLSAQNRSFGGIITGGTIASNVFTADSSFVVDYYGGVIKNNDFLRGREGVWDNSGATWQDNYWAGWDATHPVPILGTAKSVDRTPSVQRHIK